MSVPVSAAPMPPADASAIRAIMERETDAWNRHDMDAYIADMAPDVDWVNVVGMHWVGRDTVRRAHAVMHKGMFAHSRLTPPTKTDMRLIAPDVALVVNTSGIEGVASTPDGSPYPQDGNIMTIVLVKIDGAWRITHAHNTNINARAAAHDPGKAPAP